MVSCNTTLVPALGLRFGPACEAGLSAGMRRERVSWVSLRNVKSEEQARVSSGRLFHARAAATGKVRSPRVA